MANELSDKVVRITLNGSGVPVPDQDPIRIKKDNHKITWCADFDFQINVTGYDDIKHSSGGSDCAFVAKSGQFSQTKPYKYAITANGVTNDPEIDVEP